MLSVKNPDKGYCSLGRDKPPRGVKAFYTWSIINLSQIIGKLNGLLFMAFKLFGKRLNTNVVANLFGIPDILIGWIPLTIYKGIKLIRKYKIDIIYVSCKPFSSAIIGAFLKIVTRKPLVVDLRDPTIALPFYYGHDSISFRFYVNVTKAIEKFILKKVDKLIFVSRTTEERYLSAYPFLNGKTSHIYNGFFSELYPKAKIKPFDTFTITYVGNYYTTYMDSELLFQALQKIISRMTIPRSDIRFLYLGDGTNWFKSIREKYSLSDVVNCPGRVSRQKSIETLFKSSVIYLRIVEDMISTKLYEGLSTGNPLLAAISNKEVIEIIKKYSPQSIITKPHDIDQLAEAIEILYNQWKQGKLHRRVNNEYLKRFDKQFLTKEFAKELNTLSYNSK